MLKFRQFPSPAGLALLMVILVQGGCAVAPVSSNRYQDQIEAGDSEANPVAELQDQALAALEQRYNQQAINYLQRAIRIQPRNAWTWHYLARSYWQDAQYRRCLEMIERSFSYGAYDNNLALANDRLRARCEQT